jgi:hypothetical protein
MILTFEFPLPPNMTNNGHGHWRTRHRKHTAFIEACDNLQLTKALPKPPRRP